jgi:hypothetical protein
MCCARHRSNASSLILASCSGVTISNSFTSSFPQIAGEAFAGAPLETVTLGQSLGSDVGGDKSADVLLPILYPIKRMLTMK